ncbi:perlucin-like protein [Homarus americanus]|uniref:perlucin-like protein n=1 Tax=Homarus americanus TaxID=6706 RepID=UPI001C4584B9|nr:perlucin-like protein [Homarus americanus]
MGSATLTIVLTFFFVCHTGSAHYLAQPTTGNSEGGTVMNQMICNSVTVSNSTEKVCPYPFKSVREDCLYLSRVLRSWREARGHCQGLGGDLVVPINAYVLYTYVVEQDVVSTDVANPHVWVGGKKRADQTWRWIKSDAEIDSSLWHPTLPDARPDGDCAYIHRANAYPFANYPCTNAYRFICQYE